MAEIVDPPIHEVEAVEDIEFPTMDNDTAVRLGEVAVQTIRDLGLSLAVDVILADDLVFRAKLGQTGAVNNPYLAGKAALARHFGTNLLLTRLRLEAQGETLEAIAGAESAQIALYGGPLPIRVSGEIVGTITMSGEPVVVDHSTVVAAVKRFLAG
jgi:uncharacterized protein (UPF0303 family)